jgi:hypothetical protein
MTVENPPVTVAPISPGKRARVQESGVLSSSADVLSSLGNMLPVSTFPVKEAVAYAKGPKKGCIEEVCSPTP